MNLQLSVSYSNAAINIANTEGGKIVHAHTHNNVGFLKVHAVTIRDTVPGVSIWHYGAKISATQSFPAPGMQNPAPVLAIIKAADWLHRLAKLTNPRTL